MRIELAGAQDAKMDYDREERYYINPQIEQFYDQNMVQMT